MTTATTTRMPTEPDRQPIAFGQRLDVWSLQFEPRHLAAHRPVAWPTSLTNTGWPPLPLSFSIASQR